MQRVRILLAAAMLLVLAIAPIAAATESHEPTQQEWTTLIQEAWQAILKLILPEPDEDDDGPGILIVPIGSNLDVDG